jgi:hypothetical protein
MDKWAVVVVEQDAEDVHVYSSASEEEACSVMRALWKCDMATETIESSRRVDFTKSHCVESYAELWYVLGETPIKYFVQDMSKIEETKESIHNLSVNIYNTTYQMNCKLSKIEWKEPMWEKKTHHKENVEIITIDNNFIGILDEDGYVDEISISEITNIQKQIL